jgi:hypothetical protein
MMSRRPKHPEKKKGGERKSLSKSKSARRIKKTGRKVPRGASPSQYEADLVLQEYESMFVRLRGFVYAAVVQKRNQWVIELAVQHLSEIPSNFPSTLLPSVVSHSPIPAKVRIVPVERPPISLLYSGKFRPAAGAESVGVSSVSADKTGTLGYALTVATASGPTDFIMSNWHVLMYGGKAGDLVIQPGPADGGSTATDGIADVRWGKFDGIVDVALATVKRPSSTYVRLLKIKNPNNTYLTIKGTASAQLNARVWASCWKTNEWTGKIKSLNGTISLTLPDGTTQVFRNQIQIENNVVGPIPGDSGAAITDVTNKVVGLLFAGGGKIGIANKIEEIDKAIKNAKL